LKPDDDAIFNALDAMPHDLKRRLLRDLNVQILVSRPRSRDERQQNGLTPLAERVVARVGELELRLSTDAHGGLVNGISHVHYAAGFYVGTEKDPAATR
jgi:hypothetical protein